MEMAGPMITETFGSPPAAPDTRLTAGALFDLTHTLAADLFDADGYPWLLLPRLGAMMAALIDRLPRRAFTEIAPGVYAANTVTVDRSATLHGPAILDDGAEVRPGAFIRGNAIVGKHAVVGNSTELKNCILFDRVQVPHFNYIGDSILGYKAHLGAGAVTSNVRSDKQPVVVHAQPDIATGMKKLGAMVGDGVEVGCNSVLNPGTVLGRGCRVYPLSSVRGVVPAFHMVKGERGVSPIRQEPKFV